MGAPFKLTDMLPQSDTSTKAKENRRISYYDLVPSADNFYSMQDIDELKAAIELAGRVLHNLVVVPQGNGKYTILSGHRRHRAIGELLNEGKDQYEFLPCTVVDDESDLAQQTVLIAANSQREKTAWDKLEEVRQMRDIARKAKEQHGIPGRVRDLVAKSLNVSNSRIAKYDSILNKLIPTLMDEIKADRLPISVAYDLSKRTPSQQQKCFDFFLEHGKLPAATSKQPDTAKPDEPAQPDVFHQNTQPVAVRPSEPTQPDVFQQNTQPFAVRPSEPTQPDVFQQNTQPVAVRTDEPEQSDVFHRNTQPFAIQTDEWSNDACCGYIIMAMENCGFSKKDVQRVVRQLHEVMDFNTLEDAKKKFCSSQY